MSDLVDWADFRALVWYCREHDLPPCEAIKPPSRWQQRLTWSTELRAYAAGLRAGLIAGVELERERVAALQEIKRMMME